MIKRPPTWILCQGRHQELFEVAKEALHWYSTCVMKQDDICTFDFVEFLLVSCLKNWNCFLELLASLHVIRSTRRVCRRNVTCRWMDASNRWRNAWAFYVPLAEAGKVWVGSSCNQKTNLLEKAIDKFLGSKRNSIPNELFTRKS